MEWFDAEVGCPEYKEFVEIYEELVDDYELLRDDEENFIITRAGSLHQESLVLRWRCINLIRDVEIFKYGEGAEQAVVEKYNKNLRSLIPPIS